VSRLRINETVANDTRLSLYTDIRHTVTSLISQSMNESIDQSLRSTQPGHSFMGRRNEYQPKGSDALWLGNKGRYGSCVGGR